MAARRPPEASLPENRILATLPRDDHNRLVRRMDEVTMDLGDGVYRATGPIRHVYFPRCGILSQVIDMEDGGTVESTTIGREGVAGLPIFLGVEKSPFRVYCQVAPCICRRIPADVFREEARRAGPLQYLLLHYIHARMCMIAQTAGCNRLHSVEQRLARWLLMTSDRVGTDDLNLTQQIVAEMLGVRRPSVTLAAGILQKSGLIVCTRRRMAIRDRGRLEAAACECYRAVRDEFDRFLP